MSVIVYRLSRLIALLLCCLTLTTSQAQFFNNHQTNYWLKSQAKATNTKQLVGNYPVLALEEDQLQTLKTIAGRPNGTLFMVLGTSDSLIQDPLLSMGRIKIFTDHVLLAGDSIFLKESLADKARILRLSYTANRSNRFFPSNVSLAPGTYISECLFFEDILGEKEIRKVETYLALKYSINITENDKAELRHYVDGQNTNLWDARSDALFDKEVLALGHIDSLDFYQTQTFTLEGKDVQLTLDPFSSLGQMPEQKISNNSLLLLSKSDFEPEDLLCGEALKRRLWKIKLENWSSEVKSFFVILNEALDKKDYPILTNGQETIPLKIELLDGGRTQIEIPFSEALKSNGYYLRWDGKGVQCQPLCTISVNPCAINEQTATIDLVLDLESLPAQLELQNLSTGQSLSHTLYETHSRIDGLNNGQYQLNVQNNQMQLADQLVVLENCSEVNPFGTSTTNNDAWKVEEASVIDGVSQSNTDIGPTDIIASNSYRIQQHTPSKSITAYPNPAKEGNSVRFDFTDLSDQLFTVSIANKRGKLLDTFEFTPTKEKRYLEYDFPTAATYIVRFSSPNYSDHIQVVINH